MELNFTRLLAFSLFVIIILLAMFIRSLVKLTDEFEDLAIERKDQIDRLRHQMDQRDGIIRDLDLANQHMSAAFENSQATVRDLLGSVKALNQGRDEETENYEQIMLSSSEHIRRLIEEFESIPHDQSVRDFIDSIRDIYVLDGQ